MTKTIALRSWGWGRPYYAYRWHYWNIGHEWSACGNWNRFGEDKWDLAIYGEPTEAPCQGCLKVAKRHQSGRSRKREHAS